METFKYAWTSYAKNSQFSIFLSFCFPELTLDCFDRSPWFKYKSTPFSPFWSAHVCGKLILCYQDSDLIMGVYSTLYE